MNNFFLDSDLKAIHFKAPSVSLKKTSMGFKSKGNSPYMDLLFDLNLFQLLSNIQTGGKKDEKDKFSYNNGIHYIAWKRNLCAG
jgi:hypothetical protein